MPEKITTASEYGEMNNYGDFTVFFMKHYQKLETKSEIERVNKIIREANHFAKKEVMFEKFGVRR